MSDEAAAGEAPAEDGNDVNEENGSWAERRLCPDGGCVGVINTRGECGTCGKVDPGFDAAVAARAAARAARGHGEDEAGDDEGEKRDGDAGEEDDSEGGDDDEGEDEGEDAGEARGDDDDGDGNDWQDRKLCEDGACIGVVIDGRCNTCGRAG